MDRLVSTFYRFADTHDAYYNDVAIRNDRVHLFFYAMDIVLDPIRTVHCIEIMDPYDVGHVTLDSIKFLFYGPTLEPTHDIGPTGPTGPTEPPCPYVVPQAS